MKKSPVRYGRVIHKSIYGLFSIVLLLMAKCPLAQAQNATLNAAADIDTTALYIDPKGNVGIGTVNLQNKLQLGGNLHMDGNAIFFRREAQNKSAFIQWNVLDFAQKKDDKIAIAAWDGVKFGDFSQGGNLFFPLMNVGGNNAYGVVDIMAKPRTGHASPPTRRLALYVTGDMEARGDGVEFKNNGGTEGLGFAKNLIYGTNENQNINFEVTGAGNFIFNTKGKQRMQINSDGKVAISDDMSIGSDLQMGGKLFWDWPGRNITQVNTGPGASYIQFTNSDNTTGNNDGGFRFLSYNDEKATLRIKNRFVGIGTDDPQAPLNVISMRGEGEGYDYGVSSNNSHELGWNGVISKTHRSNFNRRFSTCSILANGDIVTRNALVSTESKQYSDIRLKKDITPSSSAEDMATLEKIAVVNYKMIDTVADERSYKKVIAQQVQQVYPTAVSSTFKTLPDVFQRAIKVARITDSTYSITVAQSENLVAGDRLELKCNPANDVTVTVDKILDKKNFVVISATALNKQTSVFVYGRPSNDVLAVDYDALSMLNLSATQQLNKLIKAQQKEIEQLKLQNADLSVTINAILARLTKLEQGGPEKQLTTTSLQK